MLSPATLLSFALCATAQGSSPTASAGDPAAVSAPVQGAASLPVDQALEPYRVELLELAFEASSAIPVEPHVKKRSRAQESAVQAALELDQPERALRFAKDIANWRRAVGYADYAFYCLERSAQAPVQELLEEARRMSEADELRQAWRRDRIRTKVARAYMMLGDLGAARAVSAGAVDSEVNRVRKLEALLVSEEEAEAHLAALEKLIDAGTFDQVQGAMETFAVFFDRNYDDEEQRSKLESRVKDSGSKLPIKVYFDAVLRLAGHAVEHGDGENALRLAQDAQSVMESVRWLPEDEVPLRAALATLRFRADALRPVAEALKAFGDDGAALQLYARAVEEGAVNTNLRPRAEALTATCLSMALHGAEPSEELWTRIRSIRESLGQP